MRGDHARDPQAQLEIRRIDLADLGSVRSSPPASSTTDARWICWSTTPA
ncbi:hypothetical protein P9209_25340 [Prescottella defluvii]|nr:hypothetical protein P9209_25340 [Prescottella defluvii]